MLIMKFGGTSVGSPQRIREVASLITQDLSEPKIVVLSAMAGVTNTLVEISSHFRNRNVQGGTQLLKELQERYQKVAEELYSTPEIKELVNSFVAKRISYIASFREELFGDFEEKCVLAQGELISIEMMRLYLQEALDIDAVHLPALEFMITDPYGEPDLKRIENGVKKILADSPKASLYLCEGYICRNAYKEIDNLKRGGSDYTASILGAVLHAKEVQIWTDIDGMHNNDPRVVQNTQPVRHLHFDEAAELAYFGAKILHPTCIHPTKMQNIPVRLLYTMNPSAPGTLITNVIDEGKIKAVAAKDNITVIKVVSSRMLMAYGFFRSVFEIFERHQTPIDMVTTSEVAISLSIDNTARLEEILTELKKLGTVSVDYNMTIVCIAGDFNWKNIGFESQIICALQDIPIRMISYGGSNYNVSILVRTEDKNKALEALSQNLFA